MKTLQGRALRNIVWALYSFGLVLSNFARADQSFELMYYDPKLQDYVPGYSLDLMKNGSLIGYPRKLSTCAAESPDPAACKTNMCRLALQMQAWRACQEAHAREQREQLPTQPVLGSHDPGNRPSTGGVATLPPTPDVGDPARCFEQASVLFRQRILALYSADLGSEQIAEALALNDDQLNALQHVPGRSYQVPCGMHISTADSFPRLTAPRLLRLYIMMRASSAENRPRLIATVRLAHEPALPTRALSRETWHDCFVQLEYMVFVRATAVDDVASKPLDLCPAISGRPDLRPAADQDLRRTSGS